MKHTVKNGFHTNPVKINLVGVGGGGSLVLSGLVRLHLAMKSLGHPYGLDVEVWDPDRVTPANLGRQLFAASEVGLNKAEALVNRYNFGLALNWKAHAERYRFTRTFDILIACVDSRKSRKEIFQTLPKKNGPYVLDGGVLATCGQVIIGNGSKELPYPYVELPTLIDFCVNECRQFHIGIRQLIRILHQSRHRTHESRADRRMNLF